MLKKVESALLLSNVESFKASFKMVAEELNVTLNIEEEWNNRYRISEDVVICGSKYLDEVNKAYYENLVLILKPDESIGNYISKGINRFIFDFSNKSELMYALLYKERTLVQGSVKLKDIIKDSSFLNFCYGDYDFNFDKDIYIYKGKEIFLTNSQKCYLAEWLLRHNKDNGKRMNLCSLRKKYGKNFLKEIDRLGNPKEENNEQ